MVDQFKNRDGYDIVKRYVENTLLVDERTNAAYSVSLSAMLSLATFVVAICNLFLADTDGIFPDFILNIIVFVDLVLLALGVIFIVCPIAVQHFSKHSKRQAYYRVLQRYMEE